MFPQIIRRILLSPADRPLLYLTLLLVILQMPTAALKAEKNPQLSPEGNARSAAHRYLFGEYSIGKTRKFKGDGSDRVLDEIVISEERREFDGEVEITLPTGSERVASMFRYLVLRGEGLDNLGGLVMAPYATGSHMAVSTQKPDIYRVKVSAMPIPGDSMPRIDIRSNCKPGTTAVITSIAFNSQGKLSTEFDDIPYRNLGAEFPRETVDVRIDLQHELSIDGHVDLERDKFCRYYAAPGHVHASFERWAAERNFLPGRQIMKFQPSLVVGYSKDQPKLAELADTPGAADLSFFDHYDSNQTIKRAIVPFRDIKFAMCFNDYPDFMSVKHVGRGTPLIEHFDHAAELAAAYVADQISDGGRSATWWEVKNESTIKSEWDYHWQKEYDAWALMADFHNRVADAVHRRAPGTKVGGPSSAWMQMQAASFGLYRNQQKFMDLTRDHVDFYSHHFYEDFGTLGAWERRKGRYSNYLLGRLEAILDMFRAHMHETDNIKPMLITECGSLQPGRGPSDYWLRIRSYSAYMHKFMQRPDQIELAVPFAFMSIPWNPGSGDAAFIPREGKSNYCPLEDCDPTPLHHLFDLWRDFDGRRLRVDFDRNWLDVTALHRGARLQVAITNMGGKRVLINVGAVAGDLTPVSVSQRRLYYRDGEVRYEDAVTHANASAIPVDVEETTIVTFELPRPLQISGKTQRQAFYAKGTAISSHADGDLEFTVKMDKPDEVTSATLVVGVHRDGGLDQPLSGTINGGRFVVDATWAREFNNLFAPIRIRISPEQLQPSNTVKIDSMDGLTITSVHIDTHQ